MRSPSGGVATRRAWSVGELCMYAGTNWCRATDSPQRNRLHRVDTESSHALVSIAVSAVHVSWMVDNEESFWRCGYSARLVGG